MRCKVRKQQHSSLYSALYLTGEVKHFFILCMTLKSEVREAEEERKEEGTLQD